MRYFIAFWMVAIVGAVGWGISTRVGSLSELPWKQQGELEALPLDEAATRTKEAVDRIIGNSPGRAYRTKKLTAADVTKVLDGDTIEVFADGELMIVGYIGIDAPALERPVDGPEPFAVEALERNRELVEGQEVMLERDVFEEDRLGRRLRYVYLGELMVNALLLHEGLARSDTSAQALKYSEIIQLVEQQAIIERRGGWRREWPNIARRQ